MLQVKGKGCCATRAVGSRAGLACHAGSTPRGACAVYCCCAPILPRVAPWRPLTRMHAPLLQARCGWSSGEGVFVPLNENSDDRKGTYKPSHTQLLAPPALQEEMSRQHLPDMLLFNAAVNQFTQQWARVSAQLPQVEQQYQKVLSCNAEWQVNCQMPLGAPYRWDKPECIWLQLLDVDFMRAAAVANATSGGGDVDFNFMLRKVSLKQALDAARQRVCV